MNQTIGELVHWLVSLGWNVIKRHVARLMIPIEDYNVYGPIRRTGDSYTAQNWPQLWVHQSHYHCLTVPQCRIYASVNWVNIGSGNGLSPVWRQAFSWTSACLLSTGLPGINFSESWIRILSFSYKKINLKMSSARMAAILSRGKWIKLAPHYCILINLKYPLKFFQMFNTFIALTSINMGDSSCLHVYSCLHTCMASLQSFAVLVLYYDMILEVIRAQISHTPWCRHYPMILPIYGITMP